MPMLVLFAEPSIYFTGKKPFIISTSINMPLLYETIMSIFENFIPHEAITYDEKDPSRKKKQIEIFVREKSKTSLVT